MFEIITYIQKPDVWGDYSTQSVNRIETKVEWNYTSKIEVMKKKLIIK